MSQNEHKKRQFLQLHNEEQEATVHAQNSKRQKVKNNCDSAQNELNISSDSLTELFSDNDSIADMFASIDNLTPPTSPSSHPPLSPGISDKAVDGSIVNERLEDLSDEEKPRRTFKFHDSRLRSEALELPDVQFRAYFRMSKRTFEKLHEETCPHFPQGIRCFIFRYLF